MEQSKFALDRVLYNHAEIMLCNWTFESAAKLWEKIMKSLIKICVLYLNTWIYFISNLQSSYEGNIFEKNDIINIKTTINNYV